MTKLSIVTEIIELDKIVKKDTFCSEVSFDITTTQTISTVDNDTSEEIS